MTLETCRAALTTKMSSSEGKVIGKNEEEYKWKPNYVYFEGHYYHMARFLFLNEGKVYRPGSSRMARWMASSQNDFYDKAHMFLKVDGKSTAVVIHDYPAFYDESNDDFNIGRVIRLVKTINFQKSYVCFECDIDPQSNVEVSIALYEVIY